MQITDADQVQKGVSVTVTLPSDIAQQYGGAPEQIGRRLLEEAAVEGYRSGILSRGQVARMLQLDWEETEEFLASHHCDRRYGAEDLEQDRKNLEKILGGA